MLPPMWGSLRGLARLLAVLVTAAVAGLLTLVGAATATTRPGWLLAAGLGTFLAVTAAGVALATRRLPDSRRRRARLTGFAAAALAGVAVFVVTVLLPVGDPRLPPAPVAGQRQWALPTGSRIAYVRVPAAGRPRPTPVVFLHGGPGVADMAGDAAYLAAHPDHVAKVVFSSPGTLAPALEDDSGGGVRQRLGTAQQLRPYALLARPRVLLAYALLQVNPPAAHAFVGDAELDARNDRVYNQGRAGAHCRGAGPGPALHGLGFYTFQFPQSAATRPWADPRPGLAHLSTPALVVKGSCDYLSWSSGLAYRQAMPRARLVYLRQAGHNTYQDQPAAFLGVVRAFLAGRPSPVPPWTGSAVPPDYEGPS
jgi:pimeloyl-ACP methyl ester carboxylesterase